MQNPSDWKIAEQPVESREKLRIKRQNQLFALLSPSSAPHSYANYKRTNRSSDPILSPVSVIAPRFLLSPVSVIAPRFADR